LIVRFNCPVCQHPSQLEATGSGQWLCSRCDHALANPMEPAGDKVVACLICDNTELYKKKDFPHWLGLAILAVACAAFVVAHGLYHPVLAWTILGVSALIDGVLYLAVRDVAVCYRCGAQHRKPGGGSKLEPFELGIAERFRQERIRRARLQAEKKREPS
jgi:hypothetical protein